MMSSITPRYRVCHQRCDRQRPVVVILSLIVWLVSCGGGGAGGSDQQEGLFSGRLLFGHAMFDDAWYLDLSTGHYGPVPHLVWGDDENTLCDGLTNFSVSSAQGGERLLESRIGCQPADGDVYGWFSQFALRDGDGRFLDAFVLLLEPGEFLYGPARLSPDGQRVAMTGTFSGDAGSFHVQLFSIDGEWLGTSTEQRVRDVSVDWLPDNRLIYASGQSVYIAPPDSAAGEAWLTFDEAEGEPSHLAVSPDGKQLAFTLVSDTSLVSTFGDIWVADLESGALRRLAYAPDVARLNHPIWSPDGKWIGFLWDVPTNATSTLASADYFIVPSDGEDIVVSQDGLSDGVRVQSWLSDLRPGAPPEYTYRFPRTAPIACLP
ncbi:MAG: hypothetical protein WBD20_03290 [Pirellulaceae bacterium]